MSQWNVRILFTRAQGSKHVAENRGLEARTALDAMQLVIAEIKEKMPDAKVVRAEAVPPGYRAPTFGEGEE